MNKKGNIVAEGATVMVVLFILLIISIVGFNILTDLNNEIQTDNEMSNTSKEFSNDLHSTYPSLLDGIFIFLLVGFWIAAIIFAFLVDTHPIFLVVSIILIIFILAAAAYIGNAYEEIVSDDDFVNSATNFPMANFIMSHLLQTILVMMISIVIALFAKDQI